jgi:hypothetical protein
MAQELQRIEFRSEVRWVPEYIADLLRDIDTTLYTYEEAMDRANRNLLANHIRAATQAAIEQAKER